MQVGFIWSQNALFCVTTY